MLPQRHKGVSVKFIRYVSLFRALHLVRRRVCNTCRHITPTKKYSGTDIFVWCKVSLKDATDVEFLCSSLRLFQSLIVKRRKELKYFRALIVEIVFAFLSLY